MKRKENLKGNAKVLYDSFIELHNQLDDAFRKNFNRSLPLNETLLDRWERARKLGFGKDSSIYDSSFVFGDVKVGRNCWIGPFSIIDGSGKLRIGNYVTISSGVHIYTHDNVMQTLTSGKKDIQHKEVSIGSNVYLGPNCVVIKGVQIGSFCLIAANAYVNKSIPNNSIAMGQPAKVVGKVEVWGESVNLTYFKD